MIRVLFVCLGNICRSPMAEMVLKDLVRKNNLQDKFYIDSAGTSDEERGSGMYPNTKEVLRKNGVPFTEHYARQIDREDYDKYDYIICMEGSNVIRTKRVFNGDPKGKVYRLMDFTSSPYDIDDPWYHRDFDRTYREIVYGCECFLKKLFF